MKHLKYLFCILWMCFLLTACSSNCPHIYTSRVTKEATCANIGETKYTCLLCQKSYTETSAPQEHDYQPGDIVLESTCSVKGVQNHVCSVCGATKAEKLDTLAHTFGPSFVSKEPNCSQLGELSAHCTVCGVCEVVDTVPPNDAHAFVFSVSRESTCTVPGTGFKTCSRCQYSEEVEYSLKPHSHGSYVYSTHRSCTTDGKWTRTCQHCGDVIEGIDKSTGHKWEKIPDTTMYTCSVCGAESCRSSHQYTITDTHKPTDTFAGLRFKKCKKCGLTITEVYGKKYTYDFDAISREIGAYAQSFGFHVSYTTSSTQKGQTISFGYMDMDPLGNGPNFLVAQGKAMVDTIWERVSAGTADPSKYTIRIYVNYGTNVAFGEGRFYIIISSE